MKNIVFGPINSRRFGRSLGVDLSSRTKQCNFDCVYCELERANPILEQGETLPSSTIIDSINEAIRKYDFDVLTFTANGEPMLYPHLDEVIEYFSNRLRHHKANAKTLLLSNGSLINPTRKYLYKFDIVKFSLDAFTQEVFMRVDRPHPSIKIDEIKQNILDFSTTYAGELIAEVLVVKNINDIDFEFLKLSEFFKKLNLSRVDISSIDRPPSYRVFPVDYARLLEIAEIFTGLNVSLPSRMDNAFMGDEKLNQDEIISLLARRPLSIEESKSRFSEETLAAIGGLIFDQKIEIVKVGNVDFYKNL